MVVSYENKKLLNSIPQTKQNKKNKQKKLLHSKLLLMLTSLARVFPLFTKFILRIGIKEGNLGPWALFLFCFTLLILNARFMSTGRLLWLWYQTITVRIRRFVVCFQADICISSTFGFIFVLTGVSKLVEVLTAGNLSFWIEMFHNEVEISSDVFLL